MSRVQPVVAGLPGNDWSVLIPEATDVWTPRHSVSICIPTRNPGPGLERTLRSLTAQTYPSDLIEVIVADDGSDTPIVVPDGIGFAVEVVRQERTLEFGAGAARNLAASAASGEVLFFLDADVIPERQVVESYARWFDRCDLAVPLGLCRFIDVDGLGADEFFELIDRGAMSSHFADQEVDDQKWRERHFARTNDLRTEAIDAFRVTIGATLAVSAQQFREVGGFPELGVRGVEDTAFGYRVHANGGVLILDRDAVHWHQGRRHLSSSGRQQIDEIRAPYVQSVIPVRGFRRGEPPVDAPVDVAPVVRVYIEGDGPSAEQTRRSIDRLHSSNIAITTSAGLGTQYDPAFAQVRLPAGMQWSETTVKRILEIFAKRPVGVVKAVPAGGTDAVITIARTRAVRRAHHVRPDEDPIEVASELFGVWWIDSASMDIDVSSWTDDAESTSSEINTQSVAKLQSLGRSKRKRLRSRWKRLVSSAYDRGHHILRRASQ